MNSATKHVTIEEQSKIFLKGLKEIVETTKGVEVLDEKSIDSAIPNMFFISTENKDYNGWINNTGLTSNTKFMYRHDFSRIDSKDFPLVDIAKRLYNDFKLTDCDNMEEMKLIFPNLEDNRLGTLYGYADVGMQAEMKNEPNKYYVGKNHQISRFNIQIVPHPDHLEWLKSVKSITGYYKIDTLEEYEQFVKLSGKNALTTKLGKLMNDFGYKYHNITGILFDGAYGSQNVILH